MPRLRLDRGGEAGARSKPGGCRGPTPAARAGRLLASAALAGLLVLPSACRPPEAREAGASYPDYIETGDLPALKERGYLRLILSPSQPETLPRKGFPLNLELRLARELAGELGLTGATLTIEDRGEMLEALAEGRGDLVVAGLTVTPRRRERFAFSIPTSYTREMLVVRASEEEIDDIDDLYGRSVAVRASSSFHETLVHLQERIPGLEIVTVPERVETTQILDAVARGEYEATVADDSLLEAVLAYRDDLREALPLTNEQPVAWVLRKGNPRLKAAVDRFLRRRALNLHLESAFRGDLPQIQERQVLRVLTRNSAATYFLHRGNQVGFEYELARRFARSIGCRIQVVVPPRFDDLIPWLLEGKGDLIASAMTVTPERQKRVAFGHSYNTVREMLVTRADDSSVQTLVDLPGRQVAVIRASSYYESLALLREHYGFEIIEAPPELETEDLIAMVAEGRYDLTVADGNILDIELASRDDVRGAFPIGEEKSIAWAVRPEDTALVEAVDRFIDEEYRGTFFNVLQNKYYRNRARIARVVPQRPSVRGRLSPYDDFFREYAQEVDVDWRLLAAQAYQESRFHADARSWAGAVGIMQLLPRTAREVGVTGDLWDPANAIRAGALYLRRLWELFEPTLPYAERMRFALAAYNVGRGHVQDARRLAQELGLDPDVWFENVERAMPLLGLQHYARSARYGYCRCREPVRYVREISERYAAYSLVVE